MKPAVAGGRDGWYGMGFVWARFSEAGRTVALCHTAKPLGQK